MTQPGRGHPKNRYYPRISVEILFAMRPAGSGQEDARVVRTKTLGLGGLMFEADHPMPAGSTYELDLVLGEERMQVNARVAYTRKCGTDVFQTGLAFIDPTEEQKERVMSFFLEQYDRLPPE